ncbi:MAG: alpha/beta fold hydrolase [Halanaerobiales bacterium]|nr:alpha/beta fold hydrolase [Halanaerobiales bacterium]
MLKEQFITFQHDEKEYYGVLHLTNHEISPLIVMIHGFCGDRIDTRRIFVRFARQLVKEGFHVLRVDLPGSGLSEGTFSDVVLSKEVEQVKAILQNQFINQISSSFGLIGFSEGAKIALKVKNQFDRIHSVCLWSPILCAEPEAAERMPFKVRFFRHGKTKKLVLPTDFGLWISIDFVKDYKEFVVEEELQRSQGGEDLIAFFGEMDLLTTNSREVAKDLNIVHQIIPSGDHLFTSVITEKSLLDKTLDWFKKRMLRGCK